MLKARLLSALLASSLGLAACEKEVLVEGAREPIRATATAQNEARGIALPAALSLGEWTHRSGTAAHSAPHGAVSAQPARIWSLDIGAGETRGARISAAPVIAGRQVFTMDAQNTVSSVSLGGALQWQVSAKPNFDTNSSASGGGLAVAGGKVFVTTPFGEVLALEAATGGVIWRQRLDAVLSGPPTIDGGTVFALGRDGSAAAITAANGRLLWQAAGTPSARGMLGAGAPAAAGDTVYLPFAGGEVQAANVKTGEMRWAAAVSGGRAGRAYAGYGDITGDPVLSGGTLYVGTSAGRTVAIDAGSGTRIWAAGEGALNAPLVVGGSVFTVNDESRLVRMDARTGAVIWAQKMPYFTQDKPKRLKAITAHYGPVLAGGRLAIASGDGTLRLFDPASGALVAQAEIPGGAAAAPAMAGGLLLIVSQNGQLHAFQ